MIQQIHFSQKLLKNFKDEIGLICIIDKWIKQIGKVMWKRYSFKKDKFVEGKRTVMTAMRRLATLYLKLKEINSILPIKTSSSLDLFNRKNFQHVINALESITIKDGKIQPGKNCILNIH